MAMVKVCPRNNCRMINPPNAMECEKCGRDITKIAMIDESQVEALFHEHDGSLNTKSLSIESRAYNNEVATGETTSNGAQTRQVRICDCGYQNPVSARKCESCNESLVGIDITILEEASTQTQTHHASPSTVINQNLVSNSYITTNDGGLRLLLQQGETILGRNYVGGSYFATKVYVSGRHAAITKQGTEVYIEDLNSSNGTYVNGIRIYPGNKVRVTCGDIIGFGGNHCSQVDAAFLSLTEGM